MYSSMSLLVLKLPIRNGINVDSCTVVCTAVCSWCVVALAAIGTRGGRYLLCQLTVVSVVGGKRYHVTCLLFGVLEID